MIKLIECKNSGHRKIRVKITNGILEFDLYNHATIASHAVKLDDLNDNESVTIKFSNTYREFVQYPNTFNSRDTRTFYENYYQIATDITIIIAKHSEDIVILVYGNICENLTDSEIIPESGQWLDILQKHLPLYAESYRKKKDAKVNLMRQVSPLDSISYLEKQVDILTALVLELVKNRAPDWLEKFALLHESTTSVSLTSIDQHISKLQSEKQRIRKLQSEYFAEIT